MEVGMRKRLHGSATRALPAGVPITALLATQILRVGQRQQECPTARMPHQELRMRQALLRVLAHEKRLDLLLTYNIGKTHSNPLA